MLLGLLVKMFLKFVVFLVFISQFASSEITSNDYLNHYLENKENTKLLKVDFVVIQNLNIDKIDLKEIKTKTISNLLKEYNLESVLIVTNKIDEKLFLSARNIKNVGIATVDYLDPPLMLSFKKVLILKDALKGFEKRFGA